MSEPRRPEPEPRRSERLRSYLSAHRARLRTKRDLQRSVSPLAGSDDVVSLDAQRQSSLGFIALIAVGSALLIVSGLWGWQSWSERSAVPVDDLLPRLTADAAPEGAADDRVADDPSILDPSGGPEPLRSQVGHSGSESALSATKTPPEPAAEPTAAPFIIVHVSGAVVQPGVVQLVAGSRVFEAVEMAGGARASADVDRVNLAAPLVDGERIHVPEHGEQAAPALVQSERPSTSRESGAPGDLAVEPQLLDINLASATELETLNGVGPTIAQAIVTTRERRGPFLSVEELLEVPGIGEAKLVLIRDRVTVGP